MVGDATMMTCCCDICLRSGVVVTELQKRGGLDDAAYASFLERSKTVTHPLGRVAEANEIAEAILFLCTAGDVAARCSAQVEGETLQIDLWDAPVLRYGGMLCWCKRWRLSWRCA
eukprot:2977785-Rhodomonas_salina.2